MERAARPDCNHPDGLAPRPRRHQLETTIRCPRRPHNASTITGHPSTEPDNPSTGLSNCHRPNYREHLIWRFTRQHRSGCADQRRRGEVLGDHPQAVRPPEAGEQRQSPVAEPIGRSTGSSSEMSTPSKLCGRDRRPAGNQLSGLSQLVHCACNRFVRVQDTGHRVSAQALELCRQFVESLRDLAELVRYKGEGSPAAVGLQAAGCPPALMSWALTASVGARRFARTASVAVEIKAGPGDSRSLLPP